MHTKKRRFPSTRWSLAEKSRLIDLWKVGKSLEQLTLEINEANEQCADEFDPRPILRRSPRAVAMKLCQLGFISKQQLTTWETSNIRQRRKDRARDRYSKQKLVFERDHNQCVICRRDRHLQIAHIIPFELTRIYLEKELIALCADHHNRYFDKGQRWSVRKVFAYMCSRYPDYSKEYEIIEASEDYYRIARRIPSS